MHADRVRSDMGEVSGELAYGGPLERLPCRRPSPLRVLDPNSCSGYPRSGELSVLSRNIQDDEGTPVLPTGLQCGGR